jgi:hypothetical protein
MPKGLQAPMGVVDMSTSQGHNFTYDLRLGDTIARWKGISKEYKFFHQSLFKSFNVNVEGPKNVV